MPKPNTVASGEISTMRERLKKYKGALGARPMIAKLSGSEDALRALAEMRLNDDQLNVVLLSSRDAVMNARTFKARLAKEKSMAGRLDVVAKSVSDLRTFLEEVLTPPADTLEAYIIVDSEDKRRYLHALYGIERLIEDRRRISRETLPRIGATRKQSGTTASINAGMGWLAKSIKRITGRPHLRQVCVLAATLFGVTEIGEDRLRRTLRNFDKHDWRSGR
jgi:hypothetical protein